MKIEAAREILEELKDMVIEPLLAEEVGDSQEIMNRLVFKGEEYKEALDFALGELEG